MFFEILESKNLHINDMSSLVLVGVLVYGLYRSCIDVEKDIYTAWTWLRYLKHYGNTKE